MHDERSPVAATEDKYDHAVLDLLVHEDRPWSVEEVARVIGNKLEAEDAIARLYGNGLIHRIESFVFASHAALSALRITYS